MDPVREMEILNLTEWQREEAAHGRKGLLTGRVYLGGRGAGAAHGREGLLEQVMGWLCIFVLIGAIMAAGILGGGKMVGAW